MIPKSVQRFSEKIMLKQEALASRPRRHGACDTSCKPIERRRAPLPTLRNGRASAEHNISAETGNEEHQYRRQDQLGAHAVGGMGLGIVEQSPSADEAYGCHDDEPQSAE